MILARNIILVNPKNDLIDSPWIPLGLLHLAGVARNFCDNIYIFDFNIPEKTFDDLEETIIKTGSKLVIGISALYYPNFAQVEKIALFCRKISPDCKIIIGGNTASMDTMQELQCVDAMTVGEYENYFVGLLKFLYGENDDLQDIGSCYIRFGKDVRSVSWVGLNTEVKFLPRQTYIEDLDDLPIPGYEYINFEDYKKDLSLKYNPDNIQLSGISMPISTSRGCPINCTFCAVKNGVGSKFRMRSAKNVFDEIKYLYDCFGINRFMPIDDNFTLNKQRIIDLCEMIIASDMKISICAYNGLFMKSLDKDLIHLLRKAGLTDVALAVESGDEYIRNHVIKKPIPQEHIFDVAKWCNDAGMLVRMYFIIGFPEETEDSLKKTYQMLKDINIAFAGTTSLHPFPATDIYQRCKKEGLFIVDNYDDLLRTPASAWAVNDESDFYVKPYNLSISKLFDEYKKIEQLSRGKLLLWTFAKRMETISNRSDYVIWGANVANRFIEFCNATSVPSPCFILDNYLTSDSYGIPSYLFSEMPKEIDLSNYAIIITANTTDVYNEILNCIPTNLHHNVFWQPSRLLLWISNIHAALLAWN